MKTLRFAASILLILIGLGAAGYFYLDYQLSIMNAAPTPPIIVEIPAGLGAQAVVRLLHERNLIPNENIALAYLILSSNRSKLRAGEYLFDSPMTTQQVLDKLISGTIHLHKFTVPEGLTIAETALKWEEQGFGTAAEFEAAAKESVALIRDLDAEADSLEGYLFPETYSFPSRTSARQAIEAMVARFGHVLERLQKSVPSEQWPMDLRQTVILASLIEAEAAHDEERSLVASVYLNRLRKRMLLQCDPTVIYALERHGKYRGRLTLSDLKFDSPFNTYRYPGLPPSAITNPGYRSLEAAMSPAMSSYLFFVRTEGGRHTFSESLAAHNRAVAKYRAMIRQALRTQRSNSN
jgi:UPF0755 protein